MVELSLTSQQLAADLNETSLEDALIKIAGFVDERGLIIALRGMKTNYSKTTTVCRREIIKL